MNYLDAVILGIVEGLTEFLPVSSAGHLTIVEHLLGLAPTDRAVLGLTGVIRLGAVAAIVCYFARDLRQIVRAFVAGLVKPEYRGTLEHRMGWYVIVATIPFGVAGLVLRYAV